MKSGTRPATTDDTALKPPTSSIGETFLERRAGRIAVALMALGAALRLAQYAHQRALWLDEAKLALNVVTREYAGLLGTLDRHQGAPVAFLWISKGVVNTLGRSELALRLYPLLAGLAVLPLTFVVARRLATRVAGRDTTLVALVALAIVALSPTLIYQSNEFKQYSSDVMVTLAVMIVALRRADAALGVRNAAGLALVGVAALLLSHPAVFVLAGVGLAMIITRARAQDGRETFLLSTVFGVWAFAFVLLYVTMLRPLSGDQMLTEYWANGMAPRSAGIVALLRWPYDAFFTSLRTPGGFLFPGLAGACMLVGCLAFGYRDWRKGLFVALPVAVAAGAAAVRVYPFADRLILFVVPLYAMMISVGVFFLCERLERARVWVAATLLAVLLLDNAQAEAYNALRPHGREEVRAAMQFLAREARSGDVLYVYDHTVPAFEYYRSALPPGLTIVQGLVDSSAENEEGVAAEVAQLDGKARAWALFSHAAGGEGDLVKAFLSRGKQLQERRFEGASVYLFDLSR